MSIELALLTLLVFITSAMGTFTGFGTSTIMVPVMLLFFPPARYTIICWFLDFIALLLAGQAEVIEI